MQKQTIVADYNNGKIVYTIKTNSFLLITLIIGALLSLGSGLLTLLPFFVKINDSSATNQVAFTGLETFFRNGALGVDGWLAVGAILGFAGIVLNLVFAFMFLFSPKVQPGKFLVYALSILLSSFFIVTLSLSKQAIIGVNHEALNPSIYSLYAQPFFYLSIICAGLSVLTSATALIYSGISIKKIDFSKTDSINKTPTIRITQTDIRINKDLLKSKKKNKTEEAYKA